MAKKLNSMPDYTAHLPKHPHDVSQSHAYTCCPGMLCPVYYDMLHLGDELHFSASEFVRLNPLEQQPLGQIDVHLDYFFVPLTVMFTPSSSMFYQTDDLVSSVFSNFETEYFPTYDFSTLFEDIHVGESELYSYFGEPCVVYGSGSNANFLTDFDCVGKSLFRMFDFLDMCPEVLLDACVNDLQPSCENYPSFTPWFALAYQACYQLYYRNDDREPKNYHYNIDKCFSSGVIVETPRSSQIKSIFNINYASRPKDYFNSIKVSPISSSVSLLSQSALSSLYGNVNEWINNGAIYPAERSRQSTSLGDSSTQVKPSANVVSTANIRQMFMVEKLLRVVGRAEKNYESQFLAHYGIKIPHDVMHNITHIGHDMMTITPEAVISQANTWNSETRDGSALGEVGGQGKGMLSGRKRSFTAPFHGVFLCISHIIPRRRYVAGLNKLHQLNSPAKFWQPEFDQKGMQPLFYYEAQYGMGQSSLTSRYGWQFAYEEFKRKFDKCSRAFYPANVRSGTVNTYQPWVISNIPYHWFEHDNTITIGDTTSTHLLSLLVSPNDLNVVMQVPHDDRWSKSYVDFDNQSHPMWLIYQTDPFICDFNMYCKKVNRMSEYGEPEL